MNNFDFEDFTRCAICGRDKEFCGYGFRCNENFGLDIEKAIEISRKYNISCTDVLVLIKTKFKE